MATLNEVARLAGVTTATVSNVLRNTQKVKPATVQKVQAAIAATGYRPNLMARALAEGKSSMVALVVPDITNPFYPEFVAVAERVARDRNYFLMVCNTPQRPDIGRAYLSQITGTLAGGVLVLDTCITPEDVAQISNRRAHIVLASNEAIHYSDQVPHVVLDLHRAGEIAGQHLVALGHTCIGAIVGWGLAGRQIARLGGFESALHAAGLTLLESNTRDTADTIAGGRAAEAQVHFLDDRVELAGIETGEKQRAAGDFRQGKQGAGIHAADMVFVAGQRHAQAHEARFQHLGLEVHAFDEGDLVFGELPGDFSGKSHDLLLVFMALQPSR